MMLLQATETIQAISKYDDSKIVVGIIICFALMAGAYYLLQQYGGIKLTGLQAIEVTKVMIEKMGTQQVELTGLQAIEITTEMINKLLQTPVDGHSVEKRASKLHHDVTQALKNKDDISSILITISEGQDRFINMVEKAYNATAKREKENHNESMKLQEKYLKELIKNK